MADPNNLSATPDEEASFPEYWLARHNQLLGDPVMGAMNAERDAAMRGAPSLGDVISGIPGDIAKWYGDYDAQARAAHKDIAEKGFFPWFNEQEAKHPVDPKKLGTEGAMGFMPVGTLGGRLAAHADLGALRKATQMDKLGYPAQRIWEHTGWFKDADKNWKFEIPDEKARFRKALSSDDTFLDEALSHPGLFANYPEMRNLAFINDSAAIGPNVTGRAWPGIGIGIHSDLIRNNPYEALQTAVHEGQHIVQGIEGFPHGTDPRDILGVLRSAGADLSKLPAGYEDTLASLAYRNTAGEVEARNVENRLGMAGARPIPTATAGDVGQRIYLHGGNIYQPIEHDPFVGLVEERARLGRPPHPELGSPQGTQLAPVDHDPFGPSQGAMYPRGWQQGEGLPPPLTNPSETQLAKEHDRGMFSVWGRRPDLVWPQDFRGVFDGKNVHMLSGYDSTHGDIQTALSSRTGTPFSIKQSPDGTFDLTVYPLDFGKVRAEDPEIRISKDGGVHEGSEWNAVANQPTIRRLLARKPAEPQGPSSAAVKVTGSQGERIIGEGSGAGAQPANLNDALATIREQFSNTSKDAGVGKESISDADIAMLARALPPALQHGSPETSSMVAAVSALIHHDRGMGLDEIARNIGINTRTLDGQRAMQVIEKAIRLANSVKLK